MAQDRIFELQRERRNILDSATLVQFRLRDDFPEKKAQEDVLYKLQQWRLHRVKALDKEINELRVQQRSEEEELKAKQLPKSPTPRPQTPPPEPDPFSLFDQDLIGGPDLKKLRDSGATINFYKQDASAAKMLDPHHPEWSGEAVEPEPKQCPACGAIAFCNCPEKQWLKEFLAENTAPQTSKQDMNVH
jgi:hypothetical protein